MIKELKEVLPPTVFFAVGFNLIVLTTDLILADYLRKCSVSVAPFSWLAERYGDDFAVLWIDSHPDVGTLFALVAFSAVLTNLVVAVRRDPLPTLFFKAVPDLLYAGVMLSLAFVRTKAYHSALIFLLLLVMVLGWFPLRLQ